MDELFLKYREGLYWSIMRLTEYDKQLSEDLLQDSYIKAKAAWKKGSYVEAGKFKGWIYYVATNLWRDYLRLKSRRNHMEDWYSGLEFSIINRVEEEGMNPEETYIENETKERVVELVKELHPNLAQTIERHYLDEVQYSDIAIERGLSLNTVLGQGRYGKRNLKKLLSA